jgi:hypothetical protein
MRKISGSEVFKAPMCTLFNISPGPPVGTPLSVRAPLEPKKGRARTLEYKLLQVPQAISSFLKLTSLKLRHTHLKFHGLSEEFTHIRKLTLTKD